MIEKSKDIVLVVAGRNPHKSEITDGHLIHVGDLHSALLDVNRERVKTWIGVGIAIPDNEELLIFQKKQIDVRHGETPKETFLRKYQDIVESVKEQLCIDVENVQIDKHINDRAYHGFANSILWPTLHGMMKNDEKTGKTKDVYTYVDLEFTKTLEENIDEYWNAYVEYNRTYAKTIINKIQKNEILTNDIVWLNDYNFFLVPKIVREMALEKGIKKLPKITGFLHTPFPSPEELAVLQKDRAIAILEGISSSNYFGFHTRNRDLRNYLDCIAKFINPENFKLLGEIKNLEEAIADPSIKRTFSISFKEKSLGEHICNVGVNPISIDYNRWKGFYDRKKNLKIIEQKELIELKENIEDFNKEGRKIILTCGRVDYTKGIIESIDAFKELLKSWNSPELHPVLILITPLNRTNVESYKKYGEIYKRKIDETNKTFLDKFGGQKPIHLLYGIPQESLAFFYNKADVVLSTAIRDGLNLTIKEAFLCSEHAAFILSYGLGVSYQLTTDRKHPDRREILKKYCTIIDDSRNISSITKALQDALSLPYETRVSNIKQLKSFLEKRDIEVWCNKFLKNTKSSDDLKINFDK